MWLFILSPIDLLLLNPLDSLHVTSQKLNHSIRDHPSDSLIPFWCEVQSVVPDLVTLCFGHGVVWDHGVEIECMTVRIVSLVILLVCYLCDLEIHCFCSDNRKCHIIVHRTRTRISSS